MNTRTARLVTVPTLAALIATLLVAVPATAQTTTVYSWNALASAFQSGGKYALGGDIAGGGVVASKVYPVELDLAGFDLELKGTSALNIELFGHVTLKDSKGTGSFTAIGTQRDAAAIGSFPERPNAGALTIDGAHVDARMEIESPWSTRQEGATVGGGYGVDGLHLTVLSGSLTATATESASGAAIGGGAHGDGGVIDISGGTVTAVGGVTGAGIGGGNYASGGDVTISGGTVIARGGNEGASIGTGWQNERGATTIQQRGTLTIVGTPLAGNPGAASGPHGSVVTAQAAPSGIEFSLDNTPPPGQQNTVQTEIHFGYPLSFSAAGGSPSPAKQFVKNGSIPVQPGAPTRMGHDFLGWYNGSSTFDFGQNLTSPTSLTAKWQAKKYAVTFDSAGGSGVAAQSVEYDKRVSVPQVPTRAGHAFAGWQLAGQVYDFSTPVKGAMKLTAKWTKVEAIAFIDVSSNRSSVHYNQFHSEIAWLASAGISKGWNVGGGKYEFRPKDEITREAMAAFMYRYAGSPAVKLPAKSPFRDVTPTNTNFYKEIVWMNQAGISTGWATSNGKEFRPKDEITRDAMAAFMYRFAGKPATTPPSKSPFTDLPKTSQFYKEVTWLADSGISRGWTMGGGKYEYRPYDEITREAMAAFMYRYSKL